jgi:hypothetical protein
MPKPETEHNAPVDIDRLIAAILAAATLSHARDHNASDVFNAYKEMLAQIRTRSGEL